MPDAATIAIMRDLLTIAALALAIALVVYAVIRSRGGLDLASDGNVLSRPYGPPDAAVASLMLALIYYLFTAPGEPAATGGQEPATHSATDMLGGMFTTLLVALIPLVFLKLRGLEPGEMFGIRHVPLRASLKAGVAGFFIAYLAVYVVTSLLLPLLVDVKDLGERPQSPVETFQNARHLSEVLIIAFGAVIVAPIAEETLFRGFFYGVTKRFTDRWFAAIFTSLVFACTHVHVASTLPLFVLAMGFSVAYEITGSLLVPMIMHSLFNATSLILLSIVPRS